MPSVTPLYLWHIEEKVTVGKSEVYDENLHLKPGSTMNYSGGFMAAKGQLIF